MILGPALLEFSEGEGLNTKTIISRYSKTN